MKTLAGAFIIGGVLVLAGVIALSESRQMRRLAEDEQRLATLQYEANDAGADAGSLVDRLSLPFSSASEIESQRAQVDYWRARYEALMPLTGSTGDAPSTNPDILMVAANATFRATAPEAGNTRGSVERLDRVIEAYGDVLRADPGNVDAAYNYEYVSRVRDALAKGRPVLRPRSKIALSEDLPVGPTIHGRPGGPPPETEMGAFKTFMPLQNDERGELMNRERTRVSRGRG
jgi:hypothetical protein